MLPYEQLKEKIKAGTFSNIAPMYLGEIFESRAEELKAKGEAELADKLKAYAEGFNAFAYFSATGQIGEELDRNYRENHKKLEGFKEFLESGAPGEKTNYEKIIDGMPKESYDTMIGMLGRSNEDFEFGIDVEALPKPEPAVQAGAGEAAAAGDDNEPQQALVNDDLAQAGGRMSAAAYIENIRNNGFSVQNPARLSDEQKDLYLDRFIRIMAARELANSERGSKSRLVAHELSAEEVDARAAEMKNNATFKSFLEDLKNDPAKMKSAISAATKRPGHGGGLDDMFKDYVKNQSPLHMDNASVLKRYMPTVKERLEILQKQAERYDSDKKDLESTNIQLERIQSRGDGRDAKIRELTEKKAKLDLRIENHGKKYIAAEMITLRNLCKADKGHKESLDKPIPVSDSQYGSIHYWVPTMSNGGIMDDPAITGLIGEGHGGNMMAKAREIANADISIQPGSEEEQFFNANTIKTRMDKIENEAGELREKLYDAISRGQEWKGLMKQGKELLAECLLLDGKVRNKETGRIDEAKMTGDVPWGEIDKMKQKGPESNRTFNNILGNAGPDDMLEYLQKLDENGHEAFIGSLANKTMMKTSSSPSVSANQSEIGENESEYDHEIEDNISEFDDGDGLDSEDLLNNAVDYGKNGKGKPLGGLQA